MKHSLLITCGLLAVVPLASCQGGGGSSTRDVPPVEPVDAGAGEDADDAGMDSRRQTGCSDGFCVIPAGTFMMGSPADERGRYKDETQHEVKLTRSFLMKATEVTQAEWKSLMGINPSTFAACGDDCPVETVSWYGAVAFCNALSVKQGLAPCYGDPAGGSTYDMEDAKAGTEPVWPKGLDCEGYRLPTEAEWEYAARAGTKTAFFAGPVMAADSLSCDSDENYDAIGCHCGNAGGKTHPVAKKRANAFGLFDTQGNVWEWVWDWYDEYAGNATDPLGAKTGVERGGRGGAWMNVVDYGRSAHRNQYEPLLGYKRVSGFRPARSLR